MLFTTCLGLGSQVMGCSLRKEALSPVKGDALIENNLKLKAWEKREKEFIKFAIENEVKYDPWEGYDKIKEEAADVGFMPDIQEDEDDEDDDEDIIVKNCEIVDLRNNAGALKTEHERRKSSGKNSEVQTDPPEGVDFDWDLSDKTDTETQTAPPSRNGRVDEPTDAIVQTDQRIVFPGSQTRPSSDKKVTFDLDQAEKMCLKHNWSQTRWETHDKEIQVSRKKL